MCQKEGFQIHDFFAKLSDGGGQGIVFGRENINFGLEVGEPLLFALSAFECGNAVIQLPSDIDCSWSWA